MTRCEQSAARLTRGRHAGRVTRIIEERVVVQKKLFLVEELRVHKEVIEHHEPQPVTLRREEVIVNRINGEDRS